MKTATTLLVFCVAALAALGLVMITSACIGMDSTKYFRNQTFWFGVGLGVCCLMAGPDYKHLRKFSWVIYGGGLILLALVFVPGLAPVIKGGTPVDRDRWAIAATFRVCEAGSHHRLGSLLRNQPEPDANLFPRFPASWPPDRCRACAPAPGARLGDNGAVGLRWGNDAARGGVAPDLLLARSGGRLGCVGGGR